MVAGKVKQAMGLTSKPDKPSPKPKPKPTSKPAPAPVPPPRTFGTYLTRSSAQVQPRPPDISIPDLLNLVEELRDRESRLRTELVELKLLHEMEVAGKVSHIDKLKLRVAELEAENERLVDERDVVKAQKNARIAELVEEVKQLVAAQRFQGLVEVGNKSTLIKNLYTKKLSASFNNEKDNDSGACVTFGDNLRTFASNCQRSDGNNLKALANNCRGSNDNNIRNADNLEVFASNCRSNNVDNLEAFATNCQNNNRNNTVVKYRDNLEAFAINCRSNNYNNNNNNAVNNGDNLDASTINCRSNSSNEAGDDVSESSLLRCRVPRVPKPPPKSTSCVSPPQQPRAVESTSVPPPPPPPMKKLPSIISPPPPPPPAPTNAVKSKASKVKRVPEVVEFYHSLMRRDSRKESGVATAETTMTTTATSAKNLVGEIENRSAYLLAIKTDVETQGDFIGFLIKEVETAAFTDIEDVVSFVKWLDDELSYLVDERAVLKHFHWPEQKADALREAAFEYSDLKKLESEASSFRHDARQACSTTLKKMQTLLEKLEHGAYNLSRLRESATNRFKLSHIPIDWMLDTGFVSQIKLASVKLAMKYMKRVLAELEIVGGGPEEEELIVQGVRFAFRVHQFAGGFDVETMTAFEELRDKARSYHVQSQKKQLERLACRSMPC